MTVHARGGSSFSISKSSGLEGQMKLRGWTGNQPLLVGLEKKIGRKRSALIKDAVCEHFSFTSKKGIPHR